ncbi:MAG: TonB-dependent receptor, partial [Pseudomonadota bacterium]|nr:TonB-dependent receptor [Pseudomonadota bacterium]
PAPVDGEIVVTGTRASLQSAIARKKNAGTVVDSIVAEDISQFPDKNIGEALQRITGVQLTRDFGEGTQVSIRGVEPDLNRVEINGATVLGQGGGGQRGADFRELASELVKSIDVFKGYTADLTEGGVGGTVSIQTRRPLELRRPLLAVTASGQYLDTRKTFQPRGNITGATKFFNNRLGVLVNVTYDRADTRADFLRNTEWRRFAANADQTDLNNDNKKITEDPRFANIATPQGCAALPSADRVPCFTQFAEFIPAIPRYGLWQRRDNRLSGVGTVQFAVTDNFDIYAEYQRNRRDQRLTDYNYVFDVTNITRINTANNCATCVIDAEGNLIEFSTAATAPSATTGAGSIFSVNTRDFGFVQNSEYRTLGFNWNMDRIRVAGFGINSKGTTSSDNRNIVLNATIPNIRVTLNPKTGVPTFGFPANADPNDPNTYLNPPIAIQGNRPPVVAAFQYRPEEVDVTEDHYKLDTDFDIEHPILRLVEAGVQYRNSSSLRFAGGTNFVNPQGVFVPTPFITANVILGSENTELAFPPNRPQATSLTWTREKFARFLQTSTQFTPGTFFPKGKRTGLPDKWFTGNFNQIGDFFDQQFVNHDRVREVNGVPQTPAHDIREDIWAGYLKGNFEFDAFGLPVTGNLGVRYAHTRDVSTGSLVRRERRDRVPTRQNPSPTEIVTVSAGTVSVENSYDNWLPSFNIATQFIPNELIARFGVSKLMARPRPTDLVPNANCLFDVADFTEDFLPNVCTAGNPALEPYKAWQYDANLSWYPNRDTLLSAAFFYKDVQSFIIPNVTRFDVNLFGDGELFDVRQPVNGAGAQISGVELTAQTAFTFLPEPFDGLGVQANYTYQDAKNVGLFNRLTGEELSFPGLSKHSYNLVGYYDKGFLNMRVAWNARSKYLQVPAERSGNPVFRDATGYLDAKATFRFPNFYGASFFVEGKNLTKEGERQTAGSIR